MQHPSVHLLYDSCTVLEALYCLLEQKYLIHSTDPRVLGHFHNGIPNVSTLDPIVQHIIISVNPTDLLIDMFYKPAAVPKSGFGHPGSVCMRCGCNRPLTRRWAAVYPRSPLCYMVEVEILKPTRWLLLAFQKKYNIYYNKVGWHSQEEGHGFDSDLGPCSPCACVCSLQVLWFSPIVQRHTRQVYWQL